jgi:hypothetical protein
MNQIWPTGFRVFFFNFTNLDKIKFLKVITNYLNPIPGFSGTRKQATKSKTPNFFVSDFLSFIRKLRPKLFYKIDTSTLVDAMLQNL